MIGAMDSNEPGPSNRCSQRLATAERRNYSTYNDVDDQPTPENEEIFEISELVDRRTVLTINSQGDREEDLQYLIRWKGCPESENTWESIEMFEEFTMVQLFERRLEGEGPCFNPGRRGMKHWQPLALKWKRKIAQLARQKREQHHESSELIDLTSESSDAEVIPLPRDDTEGNSNNVDPKEQLPEDIGEKKQDQDANQDDEVDIESDEDDGSTDEGSASSGDHDSEEIESDQESESETDESVHSNNDANFDDRRIVISPLPPSSPPPPPSPYTEQILTMEADSTEQSYTPPNSPEIRGYIPPNSPEIRGYIPPLLRRGQVAPEPCDEQALTADSPTSVRADNTLPVQDPSTHSAFPQTSCSEEPSGSEHFPHSQSPQITTSPHTLETIQHPPPVQSPQPSSSKNTQDSGEIILVKIKRKRSRPTQCPASRKKTVSKRKELDLSENASKKKCTALVPYDMSVLLPRNSSALLPNHITASLQHSSSALVPNNSTALVPYNSNDTLALPGIYYACSTIDGSTTSTQLTSSACIVDAEILPSSGRTDCSNRAATALSSTDLACTASSPNGVPCNSRTASAWTLSNDSTELVHFDSKIYYESAPSSHHSEPLSSCSVVNGESILNSNSSELANSASNYNSDSTPSSRSTKLSSSAAVINDEIILSSRSAHIDNCTDAEYTTSNLSPAIDHSAYIRTTETVMQWTEPRRSPEFPLSNSTYAINNLMAPPIVLTPHPFVPLAFDPHTLHPYDILPVQPPTFGQHAFSPFTIQSSNASNALNWNINHSHRPEPGCIPLLQRDTGNGFRTSGTNIERWTLKRK